MMPCDGGVGIRTPESLRLIGKGPFGVKRRCVVLIAKDPRGASCALASGNCEGGGQER